MIETKECVAPQTDKRLDEVIKLFADSLRDVLNFEIEGENVVIKQKDWLEREVWASATTVVKNFKGSWNKEKRIWAITPE